MHLARRYRVAVADLSIAIGLAVALVVLNLLINWGEDLHRALAPHSRFRLVDTLLHALWFWLAALLGLAFRRWQTAARHAREMERIISSISPDTLLVLDGDQRVTLCTASLRRLLGYEPSEIVGQPAQTLYGQWRLGSDMPAGVSEAYAREGFYTASATGRHRDGRGVPLEIIGMDLPDRQGRVLLLRNVSERLRAQQERRRLEARVEQWRRVRMLADVATHLARELTRHMEGVASSAAQALNLTPPDSGAVAMLRGIASAADRACSFCAQMLTYAGEGRQTESTVRLDDVAREAGLSLKVPLSDRIALDYLLAPVPPIPGDPIHLRQCVAVLLANAVEAIGDRPGRITLRTGLRTCDEEFLRNTYLDDRLPAGPYAFVEVSDNGPGMDEATASRMFDPFFTTKAPGRGLELPYLLGVVRRHRGAVTVRTAPGQGATVTLFLPASRAGASPS